MSNDAEQYLQNINALWRYPGKGEHPIYSLGGAHSDFYFNSDLLANKRTLLTQFLDQFIFSTFKLDKLPDAIVSYLPFGKGIAETLSTKFSVPSIFASASGSTSFSADLTPYKKVLVVADDIFTGKSISLLIKTLQSCNVEVLPYIVVLGNFSGRDTFEGRTVVSAIRSEVNLWSPSECPLCKAGSPVVANVRSYWTTFSSKD